MPAHLWGLCLWPPALAHACIFNVLESLLMAQHPDWGLLTLTLSAELMLHPTHQTAGHLKMFLR